MHRTTHHKIDFLDVIFSADAMPRLLLSSTSRSLAGNLPGQRFLHWKVQSVTWIWYWSNENDDTSTCISDSSPTVDILKPPVDVIDSSKGGIGPSLIVSFTISDYSHRNPEHSVPTRGVPARHHYSHRWYRQKKTWLGLGNCAGYWCMP